MDFLLLFVEQLLSWRDGRRSDWLLVAALILWLLVAALILWLLLAALIVSAWLFVSSLF
jgi:hypothetical protein